MAETATAIKLNDLPLTASYIAGITAAVPGFLTDLIPIIMSYAPVDIALNEVVDVDPQNNGQWIRGRVTAVTTDTVSVTVLVYDDNTGRRHRNATDSNTMILSQQTVTIGRYPSERKTVDASIGAAMVATADSLIPWTSLTRDECVTAMSVLIPDAVDTDVFFPNQLRPVLSASELRGREGYPCARVAALYQMGYPLPNIRDALQVVGEGHFINETGYGCHERIMSEAVRVLSASPDMTDIPSTDTVVTDSDAYTYYAVDYQSDDGDED